jgi:hypothetical protein
LFAIPYRTFVVTATSSSTPNLRTFASRMPSKTDDKYTDPELRSEVKGEIQAGDKGGAPGQWSARKVAYNNLTYSRHR